MVKVRGKRRDGEQGDGVKGGKDAEGKEGRERGRHDCVVGRGP